MSAIAFPTEARGQFPNASRDEQEYIKFLCGLKLSESSPSGDDARIAKLEADNKTLLKTVDCLTSRIAELEKKFAALSAGGGAPAAVKQAPAASAAPAKANNKAAKDEDDDDDIDLFGSDEDDDEAERVKQERLKAYQEKKSKKPALVAKSSIVLDVKPWDDETDMAEMERRVRSIVADGLLWGASKLVPVGYGIKKLQIGCVVEDDKIGTDFLEEEITKFEELVQSVDVAAFQKI